MNTLELFAGIGGLSLGLERVGFTVVGQVEKDPWATKILEKHWPEVPKHDDVRTALDWWRSESRPHVDLIAGGYPCQGESLNGRRRGVMDERWLWPEFARIVSALRPRYVLGENVLGHRTSGLRFVLRDLELLGYTAHAGTLAAAEVGAPHQRRRIFVLAELADTECDTRQSRRVGDARESSRGWDADRGGVFGDVVDTTGDRREPGSGGECEGARRREGAKERDVLAGRGTRGGADPWAVEPDVGRVAHGVPDRVDRLRGLGNAVVPAVGEAIGRLLLSGAWK